jgi:hypothetical protein
VRIPLAFCVRLGFGRPGCFPSDHSINQVDEAPGKKRTFEDRGLERPELPVEETIAQIESCNAWMQLRDVGRDPEYRALLGKLIEEFRPRSEPIAPGLSAPRADIFISSPLGGHPKPAINRHLKTGN